MPPDIIVTAPLPPFLYDPLKTDYRCHDYAASGDKPSLATVEADTRAHARRWTACDVATRCALRAEIISRSASATAACPQLWKRGLKVTNTPDVLTDDVADVAVALVMMTGRGFVRLNRFVHAGEWLKRGPELTTKLAGKTVGILGLGRIGKAIAQRLSAMGMKIAYTGRKPQEVPYRFISELNALAAASDFLVVACPGGAATKNIVNVTCWRRRKKGTVVNTRAARSSTNRHLVAALEKGTNWRRARRVRQRAPYPPAMLAMDNVQLLPHVAAQRANAAAAMGDLAKRISMRGSRPPLPTLIPELA
jgi:lactate dehydrogenase-like 2-hydroxyacid dehydrogenase